MKSSVYNSFPSTLAIDRTQKKENSLWFQKWVLVFVCSEKTKHQVKTTNSNGHQVTSGKTAFEKGVACIAIFNVCTPNYKVTD